MKYIKFKSSTHTASEAATLLKCEISQIVKTLIIKSGVDFYILIMPGDKRINYQKIKEKLNLTKRPDFANFEEVKYISGFEIGGVPPVFKTNHKVIFDKDILKFDTVYGGGGDSSTVLEITPNEIIKIMNPIIEEL